MPDLPDENKEEIPKVAWLLYVLLILIWGGSFLLIKRGVATYSPYAAACLRVVAAGAVLAPFGFSLVRKLPRKTLLLLLASGMLGVFLPSILFSAAAQHVPSALLGAMNALVPIYTLLVGVLFYGLKLKGGNVIGLAIGFVGTMLIMTSGDLRQLSFDFWLLPAALATAMYGFNLNIIKFNLADVKSRTVSVMSISLVLPFALLLLAFTDAKAEYQASEVALGSTISLFVLGLLGTGLAIQLFTRLVQLTNPLFTSSITYFIPMVASVIGLADGESITPMQYMGMAAVLLGVYVLNRSNRRPKAKISG